LETTINKSSPQTKPSTDKMEQSLNTEELKLCRICNDFYGSAATNWMCSKCKREENLQNQAAHEQQ